MGGSGLPGARTRRILFKKGNDASSHLFRVSAVTGTVPIDDRCDMGL